MNLSRKSKLFIGILLFGLAAALFTYKYIMKPPATIEEREIALKTTSQEILDMVKANSLEWQDKVVVISGKITSSDDFGITLDYNIYCQLNVSADASTNKSTITLKGRIIGYDDLLEELKLDQCIIQN